MRRNRLAVIALFLLALAAVFFAGPRVRVDATMRPSDLPADLDAYLAASEGALVDLTPGTEKRIVWAGTAGDRTPLSVVYLHGFSATRQETAPLAENVAGALGANLYEARFTGHGRSGEALAQATVNDWLNDAAEAMVIGRRLGDQVVVIGVSTGGTAATWLATQSSAADAAAFVLISPNFGPANRSSELLLWPWGEQLAKLLIGPVRQWEPYNDDHGRFWTNSYPTPALMPMMGLVKVTREAALTAVTRPVLVIYSPDDQVISPAAVEATFEQFRSPIKRLHVLDAPQDVDNHVLAGAILAPDDTARVADIILDFLAASAP